MEMAVCVWQRKEGTLGEERRAGIERLFLALSVAHGERESVASTVPLSQGALSFKRQ